MEKIQWTDRPLSLQEMKEKKLLSKMGMISLSALMVEPVLPKTEGEQNLSEGLPQTPADSEEFLYRTFRSISPINVPSHKANFAHENGKALREGVDKFLKHPTGHKITVYKNHSRDVGDWIGMVENAYWHESAEPGINQILSFDKHLPRNADLIRGIEIGALHSVSVNVYFDWAKSHPDMDDDKFWYHLIFGIPGKDGKEVTRNVTSITRSCETSLVWQGAIPNAKVIAASFDDGTPLQIGDVDSQTKPKEVRVDNINKFATDVFALFGQQVETPTDEQLSDLITRLSGLNAEKESAGKNIEQLQQELAKVKSDLANAEKDASTYRTSLKDRLAAASALVFGNKPEEANVVMEMASSPTTTIVQLESLVKIHEKRAQEIVPLTCHKCGSHEVSRASATAMGATEKTTAKPVVEIKDLPADQVLKNLSK